MDGLKLPGAFFFFFFFLCFASHTRLLLGVQVNGSRLGPTDKWFNPIFLAPCCLWLVAIPPEQHPPPQIDCGASFAYLCRYWSSIWSGLFLLVGRGGGGTFECVSETVRLEITEDIILSLSQDQITPTRGHYHISTLHHFFIHTSTHSSALSLFYFLSFCPTFLPFFFLHPLLRFSSHPIHY